MVIESPSSATVRSIEDGTARDEYVYFLLIEEVQVKLEFPPALMDEVLQLSSGYGLQIQGVYDEEVSTILVDSFIVEQTLGGKGYGNNGGPINVTSVTFILNICNKKATVTNKGFRSTWVNSPDTPRGVQTMQEYHSLCSYGMATFNPVELGQRKIEYHSLCSYGKATFTPENNLVLGPIDLPCGGTSSLFSGGWTADQCRDNELFAWAFAAEKYAQDQGIDLRYYKRRILLLPPGTNCFFAGLASIGCGSKCYTWLPLGWADAIAEHNQGNLPAGAEVTYSIPGTQRSDVNYVKVTVDWQVPLPIGTPFPNFFISYREAIGGDSGLTTMYNQKVSVHIYNGDRQSSGIRTELQKTLSPGQTYTDRQGSLSITFISIAGSNANVMINRKGSGITRTTVSPSPLTRPTRT
eukprot:gene23368-30630_t